MINMLMAPQGKVQTLQEQPDNVSREMEMTRKNQKEIHPLKLHVSNDVWMDSLKVGYNESLQVSLLATDQQWLGFLTELPLTYTSHSLRGC